MKDLRTDRALQKGVLGEQPEICHDTIKPVRELPMGHPKIAESIRLLGNLKVQRLQ